MRSSILNAFLGSTAPNPSRTTPGIPPRNQARGNSTDDDLFDDGCFGILCQFDSDYSNSDSDPTLVDGFDIENESDSDEEPTSELKDDDATVADLISVLDGHNC
ncbi:unnamed protein product [Ambrosiozyma monospora]|uniref:Unnamed protein product n=1 Tax=Ambrosiozyma monospora TaxID=43982 RepID=A0ACB5T453_AMBMO|nr:unnamed protein product [Ambrosiozyma monospora]